MSTITTKDGTGIYYKEWGAGQPVVFSHGWPLTADSWEAQMFFLACMRIRASCSSRRYERSTSKFRCDAADDRWPRRLVPANMQRIAQTL